MEKQSQCSRDMYVQQVIEYDRTTTSNTTHNLRKNMTAMGNDTIDLTMVIRWFTNMSFHSPTLEFEHVESHVLQKR